MCSHLSQPPLAGWKTQQHQFFFWSTDHFTMAIEDGVTFCYSFFSNIGTFHGNVKEALTFKVFYAL